MGAEAQAPRQAPRLRIPCILLIKVKFSSELALKNLFPAITFEIEILLERDYNKNDPNQIPRGSVTQRVYLKAILWQNTH